jgi:hypothetical protein
VADVFISSSALDDERVKPIAERLQSLGYAVWRRMGEVTAQTAAQELENARAVLVVWSGNAANSSVVQGEAAYALDHEKLMQLRLDDGAAPYPFNALAIAEITPGKSEWGPLEAGLQKLVRERKVPDLGEAPKLGLLATPSAAGAPKLLIMALAAVLAAYAGAVMAALNGAMSVGQAQLALIGVVAVAGACAALSAHRFIAVRRAGDDA